MTKNPTYSPWKLLSNQAQALAFLAVEVLAAFHIGFGHVLAWSLMVIAAWNAFLIIAGTFGAALVAAKYVSEIAAGRTWTHVDPRKDAEEAARLLAAPPDVPHAAGPWHLPRGGLVHRLESGRLPSMCCSG